MLVSYRAVILTALFSFGLFAAALFYQHVFDAQPCFKCIQQRSLILMAGVAMFITWLVMNMTDPMRKAHYFVSSVLSMASVLFASFAAYHAFMIAKDHMQTAKEEFGFLFSTCQSQSPIPQWLPPLDEIIPSVFAATGSCGDEIAKAFGLEMPVYVMIGAGLVMLSTVYFLLVQLGLLFRNHH